MKLNQEFIDEFTEQLILNSKQKTVAQEIQEPKKNKIHFDKITPILNDPKVTNIECPGPNRFLIITTHEKELPSKISLTKEEINKIIEQFTDKTLKENQTINKIHDNFILTAIQSEFIGPKFILTKIRT